jgi:FkbM family methyltransferase
VRKPLYAFPHVNGHDDPLIGLAQTTNESHPGFIRLAVDGGAGVGNFTDELITGIAGSSVIAFEPLPDNVRVMQSRFGGSPAVDIRELAIGDRQAQVRFEIPERAGIPDSMWEPGTSYAGFVSRSLLIPTVKSWAKRVLRRSRPNHEVISVRMARLDTQLHEAPDLIKLDLEGGEPAAVAGLGALLAETKVMKIEVLIQTGMPGQGLAKSECVRALRAAGFHIFVQDFLFAVPEANGVSEELRRYFTSLGVEIDWEKPLSPSQPLRFVQGRWPEDRPLPIEGRFTMGKLRSVELNSELARLLAESNAAFFMVDLIALNGRYAKQWTSALPESLLERGKI